jgi:hypothetical protein
LVSEVWSSPRELPFYGSRALRSSELAVSSSEVGPELLSEAALLSAAQAAATNPRWRSVARMGGTDALLYTSYRELSSPLPATLGELFLGFAPQPPRTGREWLKSSMGI